MITILQSHLLISVLIASNFSRAAVVNRIEKKCLFSVYIINSEHFDNLFGLLGGNEALEVLALWAIAQKDTSQFLGIGEKHGVHASHAKTADMPSTPNCRPRHNIEARLPEEARNDIRAAARKMVYLRMHNISFQHLHRDVCMHYSHNARYAMSSKAN